MNATAISEAMGTVLMILRGAEKYRVVSGILFAWAAVVIYAASNSIVTLLVGIGETMPVDGGRNAITYSNLLLLGTLISVVPLSLMFRRDLTRAKAHALSRRDWTLMTVSAFLSSALTPGLFFFALAHTSVTNVVLITRIEPPLFLLAALFILNERFRVRAMMASVMALTGAVVIIGWSEGGSMAGLGKGEWAAVAATVSYVASTIVTRAGLQNVPLGLFSVYRTIAGAAIYFVAISLIYGPQVFQDIFAPVLWNWIWVYTGIVIVLGQVAWATALKYARSSDLALATSFSPLAGIMIAMILLGENPGPGLLPGAAIILLSIYYGRGSAFSRVTDTTRPVHNREPQAPVGACPVPVHPRHVLSEARSARPARRRLFQLSLQGPMALRHAVSPIVAGAPPGRKRLATQA